MSHARRGFVFATILALGIACAGAEDSDDQPQCIPGEQVSCACSGNASGIQVCNDDGTFGSCSGCSGTGGAGGNWPDSGVGGTGGATTGGASGTGGSACTNHCTNTLTDCGETGIDCGGECNACPPSEYVIADCYVDTPRNGSEDCDDGAIPVPSNPPLAVLVCLDANGGVIYLSTNTGPPVPPDPVARCSGWELNGMKARDYLSYIAELDCDAEQKTLDVDLSPYAGQTIYIGAHTQPDGSGHGTIACVQPKK